MATIIDIGVQFGGVSIGDTTARLGVKVDRAVLSIADAAEHFIERRLTLSVAIGGEADQAGQRTFWDMTEFEISAVADSKRIGVGGESIAFGLTFAINDVDVATLAKLSKGSGRLKLERVAEIPHDAAGDESDEVGRGTLLDAFDAEDSTPLIEVTSPACAAKLAAAGLDTVDELDEYTRAGNELASINGIGPAAVKRIQTDLEAYLRSR